MLIDILDRSSSAYNLVRRLPTLIFQASGRDPTAGALGALASWGEYDGTAINSAPL